VQKKKPAHAVRSAQCARSPQQARATSASDRNAEELMSRWSLLLSSSSSTAAASAVSIHRFEGFDTLVPRKRVVWPAFRLALGPADVVNVGTLTDLTAHIDAFLVDAADCCECLVSVAAPARTEAVERIVREGVAAGRFRVSDTKSAAPDEALEFYAVLAADDPHQPLMKACEYRAYRLPADGDADADADVDTDASNRGSGPGLATSQHAYVYTRERSAAAKVTRSGLLSHRLVGVDNTGNVRVWSAEPLLMRTLLAGRVRGRCAGRRVLELGGGMTGLCGLGLAARGGCAAVTVTDGHPDCVRNTAVGLTMSRQAGVIPPRCAVRAARLRWSADDAVGDFRRLLDGGGADGAGGGGFDVVVAADCLFFEDFHDALLWTLEAALTSNGRDGAGAAAYLLQVRDSACG
jgi:hypothetical protein